jgi:NADPH-dependent 2,4-dienoyl-CoA reductase/sulfur reductase-like enzyme
MHHVILGNGVAGIEAASVIRNADASARISIVSSESDHFFSRPALMYVFSGQMRIEDTEPHDRGFYARMGFERVRASATGLDAGAHRLSFSGGDGLSYDRLLIAAGSRARPAPWPGAVGQGVHSYVTLGDHEQLDRDARPGQRAMVIGGGLIGVEVAEILHHRGLRVTYLIRDDWYFPMALDASESSLVAAHMRRHGIEVRTKQTVEAIERSATGMLTGVRLSDGSTLAADLVAVAIGVVPNTGWLAHSGLDLSPAGAIEVDDALRASRPDVFAAGDCANVTWADGSRRPEQLWYTARDQGRVAGASMLGESVAYRRGPMYNSAKFFDVEWTTAGDLPVQVNMDGSKAGAPADVSTWYQESREGCVSHRIVCRGDKVIGFNFLGTRFDQEPLLQWIAEGRSLDYVLARLGAAQFDEEFSPRFEVRPDARLTSGGN